jgi:DNA-binding transcriptional MocR family regulator
MSAVLKHIATVAKGLSKAELHVLIELASRAEEAGQKDAVASSRELAEETGLARSSVQSAIDSLNSKGVIRSDAGTATRSAMHRLLFLDAVEIRLSGPKTEPEWPEFRARDGPSFGPGWPGCWATPEREINHLRASAYRERVRARRIDRKERFR